MTGRRVPTPRPPTTRLQTPAGRRGSESLGVLAGVWLAAASTVRSAVALRQAFAALARALRAHAPAVQAALLCLDGDRMTLPHARWRGLRARRLAWSLAGAPPVLRRLARGGAHAAYVARPATLLAGLPELAPALAPGARVVLAPVYGRDAPTGVLLLAGPGLTRDDLPAASGLAELLGLALQREHMLEAWAAQQRTRDELFAIQRVAQAVNSARDLPGILHGVVTQMTDMLGYRHVAVYLREGERLRLHAHAGYRRVIEEIPIASGVAGRVARTGEAAFVRRAQEEEEFLYAEPEIQQAVLAPLSDRQGRSVGVVVVESAGERVLDEGDLALLRLLCDQISVAAENAQLYSQAHVLYQEIERRAEEVSAMLVVASAVSTPLELEVRLEAIAHHARRLAAADSCTLYRFSAERNRVLPLVSIGADGEPQQVADVHLGEDVTGRVALTGLPEIVNRTRAETAPDAPACVVSVPLISGNDVLGAMTLDRQEDARAFEQRDVNLLQSFAVQAALAIQNAELIEKLRQRALSLQQAYDELAEARTTVQEAYQRAWLRQLLDDVSALSLSTLNPDELAQRALDTLLAWIGPSIGALLCHTGDSPALESLALRGIKPAALHQIVARVPVPAEDDGAADGEILVQEDFGETWWIEDAPDPAEGLPRSLATLVQVPLKARGKLIGLVYMITTQPRRLTDAELTVLQLAADQLGLGIDNARLYQQVSEQNRALARVTKELESFTYSVSHDLKAPLRGIEGFTRALQEDYGDRLDDDGRHYLDLVRSAAMHLSSLIDDLLAYSRLERRSFALASVNLPSLLERLLGDRSYEIDRRHVEVRVELPFEEVWGEREGIGQLLANLIDNAITYSRDREHPLVVIGGREEPREHIIWVRDNGIGFDMRYHNKIFEMFQRLHRAEDYPGTGVGLAIAKKIAERLQGRIWAESVEGQGSTFYFALPRRSGG
jgi:signal transduction histidine kinase/putative methionine-R-sulfoxide reductase with GAF domain